MKMQMKMQMEMKTKMTVRGGGVHSTIKTIDNGIGRIDVGLKAEEDVLSITCRVSPARSPIALFVQQKLLATTDR